MVIEIFFKQLVNLNHNVSLFAVFFARENILIVVDGNKDNRRTDIIEAVFEGDIVADIVEIKQRKVRNKLGIGVTLFGCYG